MATKKKAEEKKVKDPIDLEGNFEKYKLLEIQILEVKRVVIERVDSYGDLYMFYREFFGENPNHETVDMLLAICEELTDRMLEVTKNLKLEDFQKNEWEDPYASFYKGTHECTDTMSAFENIVKFNYIRPFAERLINVYKQVQADMKGIEDEEA